MQRWMIAGGLVAVLFLSGAAGALAQQEQPKAAKPLAEASKLPLCPVMDEPIDVTVKTMTDDGPVYFCCDACIGKFTKDPQKYAAKVAAQREALQKLPRVQVSCPITGEPVDGKTSVTHDGQTVYFCCGKCPAKFQQEPAKYRAKLAASYTYQTLCPVSGEKIDATAFVDLPTSQRIYLCCKSCGDKLLASPEKYVSKLAGQGINVDVKKLKTKPGKEAGHGEHEGHEHP